MSTQGDRDSSTDWLTLALPKGRPTPEIVEVLGRAGFDASAVLEDARHLVAKDPAGRVRFLIAKPFDVPAYVEAGAADLGVVGKDVLMELEPAVAELLDLGVGRCRMEVAVPVASAGLELSLRATPLRVATRYPRVACRYFREQGLPVHVVALHGSIELAPQVGLADAIVDLVQTGATLKANGLVSMAVISGVSARLIANPVRWKLKHDAVQRLAAALAAALPEAATSGRAP